MPRYHSAALRRGRVAEISRAYLITTACAERRALFNDLAHARTLIRTMHEADQACAVKTLAYVAMPDHVHWLFVLLEGDLASTVRTMKSRTAIALNRLDASPGRQVWQAGFHDHAVRAEEDLVEVARYVVANPVRAGLVGSIRAYPHWDAVWI
jgi:REP element-mobilizing transposase RayT